MVMDKSSTVKLSRFKCCLMKNVPIKARPIARVKEKVKVK